MCIHVMHCFLVGIRAAHRGGHADAVRRAWQALAQHERAGIELRACWQAAQVIAQHPRSRQAPAAPLAWLAQL